VFLGKREIIADRLTAQIDELSRLLKHAAAKAGKRRSRSNGGG